MKKHLRMILSALFVVLLFSSRLSAGEIEDGIRAYYNKNFEKALYHMNNVLSLDSTNYKAVYYRGMSYLYMFKPMKTVDDFNTLLRQDQTNADYYNCRGLALTAMSMHDKAALDYSDAIKFDPKFSQAYLNRGAAYVELKKYKEALSDLNKSADLDADNPELFFQRGIAKYHLGDYQGSLKDFNKSVDMGYESPELYYQRGNCNYRLKKYKEATVDYTRVLRDQPERIVALNNRAMCYELMGSKMMADADRNVIEDIKNPARNFPPAESLKLKTYKSDDKKISIKLPVGWHTLSRHDDNITELLVTKSKITKFEEYYKVGVRIVYNKNTKKLYNTSNQDALLELVEKSSKAVKDEYTEHTQYQRKTFNKSPWKGIQFLEVIQETPFSPTTARYEVSWAVENKLVTGFFQAKDRLFDYYQKIYDKAIKSVIIK